MKVRFFISLLIFLPFCLSSQSSGLSVVSAGGDRTEGRTMTLDWTLGETAVSTIHYQKGRLTEGFHQPVLKIEEVTSTSSLPLVGAAASEVPSLTLTAAPNPVMAQLQVDIQSDSQEEGQLEMISINGQRLAQENVMLGFNRSVIEMGLYPGGTYYLILRDQQGQVLKAVKVIKVQ